MEAHEVDQASIERARDMAKMKKYQVGGSVTLAVGGVLIAYGMFALLGWPGAIISVGVLLFVTGFWQATNAKQIAESDGE